MNNGSASIQQRKKYTYQANRSVKLILIFDPTSYILLINFNSQLNFRHTHEKKKQHQYSRFQMSLMPQRF